VARHPYSGRGIGGNAHDYNLALTQVPDLITELTNSAARQSETTLIRMIDPDCMKKIWSHVLANTFGPPPETSGNTDEDEENGQNNLRCSVASINTAVNFANTCNFCKLSYRDQKTELDAETVVTEVGEEAKNGESDGNYYKQRFLITKIKGGLWLPLKAEGSETWILIYRNRDTRCMKAYNKVVCCFATIVSENAYNCVEICLDDAMVLFSGHDLKKALWSHDDLTVKRRSTKGGGKLINTYFDDAVDSEFHKNIHDENDLINDTVEFSYYLSATSDFFNKRLVIKTGSKTTAACWKDRCFTLEPIELRKFATAMGAYDIVDVAICRGAGEAGGSIISRYDTVLGYGKRKRENEENSEPYQKRTSGQIADKKMKQTITYLNETNDDGTVTLPMDVIQETRGHQDDGVQDAQYKQLDTADDDDDDHMDDN